MDELREYGSTIFQLHGGKLLRFIQRIGGQANSEDILQEVFVRFLREAESKRIKTGLELPWLYRVARNLSVDVFRRSRKNSPLLERELESERETPEERLFQSDLSIRMFAIASKHGEAYTTLLHLLMEQENNQAGIGKILGKSERTVRRMTEKLYIVLEQELRDLEQW